MPSRTSLVIGWLVLFGASFALFLVVALLAWWGRRPGRRHRRRHDREREEWAAHAAVVAERSTQAAARAAAARERAAAAERERAEAWRVLEEAHHAYQAAQAAYQEAARSRPADLDPAGQRVVATAALAAYRRGDLSQEELLRVWRWGSGWDPRLEEHERAVRQTRAAQREAHLRYLAAANAERSAGQQADLAEAEARVLAEEAAYAAAQAGTAPEPT